MNIKQLFQYQPAKNYNFTLNQSNSIQSNSGETTQEVYPNVDLNLKFIKNKYSSSINSDIMIREFLLTARNVRLQSFSYLYWWNGQFWTY